MSRASVARYWRKAPWELRRVTFREYRVAAEAMGRFIEAENEAIKRAKAGLPPEKPQSRKNRGPRRGDTVQDGGRKVVI